MLLTNQPIIAPPIKVDQKHRLEVQRKAFLETQDQKALVLQTATGDNDGNTAKNSTY